MAGLLSPTHLLFILLIVLIIFGPDELPRLGRRLDKGTREFQGAFRDRIPSKSALFMASGVDPDVGRDVGDVLPDEEADRGKVWIRSLLALLIGNAAYFISLVFLPAAARMNLESQPWLAVIVDAWFCLFAFGVLSVAATRGGRAKPRR